MVRYILDKLGTDIEVVLKVDQVIFRSGDVYEQIVPVVYMTEQASEYRVLAVGNAPEGSENFLRINLFDGKELNTESFEKSRVLEAFFEYGITKIMDSRAFIRPRVRLIYGDKISKFFGGYEKMILRQAVVNAGAREVVFSPTPQVV